MQARPFVRLSSSILAAIFLLAAAASNADSVRLEPVADNTLFEDADGDTSNGAGPALFAGNNNQNGGRHRRALIVFDLASALPQGVVVDSARLDLHISNSSDWVPRLMTIHRMLSAWGEGQSFATGGVGARATPGDASWTCAFYPDRLWRDPGGDFQAEPSASLVVGGAGVCAWTGPGLASDVADWLRLPESNFGWIVLGDESGPGTARRFDSREHSDPANRPSLTVYYSPAKALRLTTWGSIKAAYR
jgi:hypothetical protein